MKLRLRIGLLASQALNALAFGGDPDESLSARAHRQGWARASALIDRLLGAGHCRSVWAAQRQREIARNIP